MHSIGRPSQRPLKAVAREASPTCLADPADDKAFRKTHNRQPLKAVLAWREVTLGNTDDKAYV